MNLTDSLARAFHAHRQARFTLPGRHAPESCPWKTDPKWERGGIRAERCSEWTPGVRCQNCDPLLRSWDALSDAQRGDLRREVAWAVEAVGPVLALADTVALALIEHVDGNAEVGGCYDPPCDADCQDGRHVGRCDTRKALDLRARLAELGATP